MDAALVELVVVFGIVLGLALWELYRIDRELRNDRGPDNEEEQRAGEASATRRRSSRESPGKARRPD